MRALSIIAVVSLLMGCAKSFVLATGDETSAIDFSKSMKVGMSSKLDKLIVPILRGRTEEKDGYKIYESTFFPVEGGSGGIIKSWTSYCESIGGTYSVSGGCEDESEKLLFFSKVWATGNYSSTTPQYGIQVIEPTIDYSRFMMAAKKAGYKTRVEIAEAQLSAAATEETKRLSEAQQAQEKDRQRLYHHQSILKSGVGSKVCHEPHYQSYRYIGFIDRIENNRAKISVQFATIKNGGSVGGFNPFELWVEPLHDWALC